MNQKIIERLYGYESGGNFISSDTYSAYYVNMYHYPYSSMDPNFFSIIVNADSVLLGDEAKQLQNIIRSTTATNFRSMVYAVSINHDVPKDTSKSISDLCLAIAKKEHLQGRGYFHFANRHETLLTFSMDVKLSYIESRKDWSGYAPELQTKLYEAEMERDHQLEQAEQQHRDRLTNINNYFSEKIATMIDEATRKEDK